MNDEHPGTEELQHRLEAYASARLALRRGSAGRMRSALVEEARMRSLSARMGGGHRRGSGPRRSMALVLAAALGLVTGVVTFAGSAPGTPFYEAKVWLGTVTLPADVDARALERIRQLEGRLVDSEKAAVAADENAVEAATEAYTEAVTAAVAEVGTDAGRLDRLEATLTVHVAVLEALAERLPDAAADGIDRAIEASQQAVERINQTKPDHGQPGNRPPNGGQPGDGQ